MHTQRITVTLHHEECAHSMYHTLKANSDYIVPTPVVSFAYNVNSTYTVATDVPCMLGNGPLTNVWRTVQTLIPCCVLEYTSRGN